MSDVQSKEIQIVGSNIYNRFDFNIAIAAIASGLFDVSEIIYKIFPIEQAAKALQLVDKNTENVNFIDESFYNNF